MSSYELNPPRQKGVNLEGLGGWILGPYVKHCTCSVCSHSVKWQGCHVVPNMSLCKTLAHWNTLQRSASRCNALHSVKCEGRHVAPNMSLCKTLPHWNTLQHSASRCNALHSVRCEGRRVVPNMSLCKCMHVCTCIHFQKIGIGMAVITRKKRLLFLSCWRIWSGYD